MAQSLAQLQKQIAALQAQAAKIKQDEVAGVIARIKDAVKSYGLTAKDIFGARASGAGGTKSKSGAKVAYSDGKGNTWVGRGPRPQWLREALAAGKQLSDFAVSGGSRVGNGATRRKATGKRKAGRIKFKDGNGNSWTGHGRRPQWFMDAIAAGKKPEDLAA